MEKVLFKYMYNFVKDNNLLTDLKSGFTPGDSTTYQLVDLYHIFCSALDQKKEIRIIFCDISKAFDTVWHKGLLHKLEKLQFRGEILSWLSEYLSNRQQRVVILNGKSDWQSIQAGVPQGSVLGLLLFLLCINDISKNITCDIRLFADDTCIYLTVDNDPNVSAATLNENLQRIWDWSEKWLLKFNPVKTDALIFSLKK